MTKYWYVVQNEKNKKKKEYMIGYLYGISEAGEEAILEGVQDYCKENDYRLVLLIQVVGLLGLVNQLYPFNVTEESSRCLEYAVEAALKESNV